MPDTVTGTEQKKQSRGRAFAGVLALALSLCILTAMTVPQLLTEAPSVTASSGRGAAVPEITLPSGEIRINSADAETLTQLPGIGESKAAAIIAEREANGPFRYPEDLAAVSGIGDKTVAALRELISME